MYYAVLRTPEKISPSAITLPAKASTTPHQPLNSSHESDDDPMESTIDDDDDDVDDECNEQSANNDGQTGHSKRNKKTRTVFSRSQVFQLESTFDIKK